MAQFFAMGGYAVFVWPAYALSVIVLALMVAWTLRASRREREALRRVETQERGKQA
jgi:heme exporter protein D